MDICSALDMLSTSPKEYYLNELQEAIDQDWGVAFNTYKVQEETFRGSFEFKEIEVLINHIVESSTGEYKDPNDYAQIVFRELDHDLVRGRLYLYEDNYWLTTAIDKKDGASKTLTVRRCNNWLSWDGKKIPCVVDYEASSSQPVINESVNTPNSTIKVIVQGNLDTLGLDVNQKFLIGNSVKKRPYRIINYNDYLQNGIVDDSIPLVYLDLQLIQKSSSDEEEIVPPVTGNRIEVTPEITEILQGRTVVLKASVLNDDTVVEQLITCTPSNAPESNYTLTQVDNEFTLTNLKPSSKSLVLTFESEGLTKIVEIRLRAKF